jgi:putative oxidoreductase
MNETGKIMLPANSAWTEVNSVWAERVLSLLRIMAGLLFLQHGLTKMLGFPGTRPPTFEYISLSGLSGLIEFVGGAMVAAGLFTRVAAFVMSGEMAVAYFMAHEPRGFFPLLNGGELAILYCFVFLYLAFAGGGAWSLDRRRGKS